jgi:hypothetical protein
MVKLNSFAFFGCRPRDHGISKAGGILPGGEAANVPRRLRVQLSHYCNFGHVCELNADTDVML